MFGRFENWMSDYLAVCFMSEVLPRGGNMF